MCSSIESKGQPSAANSGPRVLWVVLPSCQFVSARPCGCIRDAHAVGGPFFHGLIGKSVGGRSHNSYKQSFIAINLVPATGNPARSPHPCSFTADVEIMTQGFPRTQNPASSPALHSPTKHQAPAQHTPLAGTARYRHSTPVFSTVQAQHPCIQQMKSPGLHCAVLCPPKGLPCSKGGTGTQDHTAVTGDPPPSPLRCSHPLVPQLPVCHIVLYPASRCRAACSATAAGLSGTSGRLRGSPQPSRHCRLSHPPPLALQPAGSAD